MAQKLVHWLPGDDATQAAGAWEHRDERTVLECGGGSADWSSLRMRFRLAPAFNGRFLRRAVYALCGCAPLFASQTILAKPSEPPTGTSTFVSTYAGTGVPGNAVEGESRYRAAMTEPYGLACDADGNLYFSDYESNRVRRVDARSGRVTTAAEVAAPQGLALDGRETLYVGSMQGVVQRIDLKTGKSDVVAGGGTAQVASGPATAMALAVPAGVRVDSAGNVYIADANLHAVFRLTPATGQLTIVVGQRGQHGFAGDGGPATEALLNNPADAAIDDAGNLYVADSSNHVIRFVDANDGTIRTLAGTPGSAGYSGDGGAAGVRFHSPQALLLVGTKKLLIADVVNHRVRELDLKSGVVITVAGTGSREYKSENVTAREAPLPFPTSIAASPSGTLYVSSSRDYRIIQVGAPSVIPRPWWLSPWTWLAAVVVLASLLYGIAGLRARQLSARARALEAEVEKRTRELVGQNAIVEQQAERLGALAATKDQVLTRISHEFRTPLTVILGPLQRVREQTSANEERRYLDAVERNASRLLRLVDQMLGLTRIGAGQEELTVPVAVAPILEQIVASFESLAEDRGIVLSIVRADALVLQSTADAFEKIAVNLISNAIKYTAAGGRVSVSQWAEGALGVLAVADNGRGIAAEFLERIFEPFERAHDEAERIPGSGLGLAVVRELTEAHGGRVEVDSVPGNGSTFRVYWPLASGMAEMTLPATTEQPVLARIEVAALRVDPTSPSVGAEPDRHKPAVLVIEDNADMRRYMLEVFAPHYRCLQADDGQTAVALAIAEVPDVVVSDIILPGQDGYAVCRQLKSNEITSHVPVVLLTALGDQDHKLRGLGVQADDYLAKPFSEPELLLRIRNLLEIRAILQRRYARDLRFDRTQPEDLNERDRAFLAKLGGMFAERHPDAGLDLHAIASAMAVSERQLQRKLKALIGLTPAEYLRDYRLQRAHERLVNGERSGAVALASGFASHAHFSSCFKAQFGYPPSEARERTRRRA